MRARTSSVVLLACVLAPVAARGDWPVGRHDAQRTGAADGTSNILQPEERWRYYLGGALGTSGAIAIDVDGADEAYAMVAGGALIARRLGDSIVWRVPPRDITSIIGQTDLDGNGDAELVVGASRSLLVIDAASGAIEWETAPGTMGLLGGVRIGDLSGDGLDDLIITECGPCCAVPGTWPGAAYSFAAGATAPVEMWQLPQVTCGHSNSLTLLDADGDGGLEVMLGTFDTLQLIDGPTGEIRDATGDVGTSIAHSTCTPVDVDADGDEEAACVHNGAFYAAERSTFVVDWVGDAIEVSWRRYLGNNASAELRTVDLTADLGEGVRVIASVRAADGTAWTTHVIDATTGELVDTLEERLVVGTVSRGAGGRYLVTVNDEGLQGWIEDGDALAATWERPGDESPLVTTDRLIAARAGVGTRIVELPTTRRMLVVPRSATNELRSLELTDMTAMIADAVRLGANVGVAAAFLSPGSAERPVAVARTDGYLTPFDEQLQPQLGGGDDVFGVGITTGGYYSTGSFRALGGPPRTGDVDADGHDEVIVHDTRGVLLRLDADVAGQVVAPHREWVIADNTSPMITYGAGGAAVIASIERDTSTAVATYAVAVRAANGAPVWTHPLPGPAMVDLVPADLDRDDVPDVVVQWGAPSDLLLHTRALSGVDGELLWEDVSDPGAGRAPAGVAAGPWLGQPGDAVVQVGGGGVSVLAGGDGTTVAESAALNIYYFLPMLADVDGDAPLEIALTGGFYPIRLLDNTLAQAWVSLETDQRPFPYGAIARCPDERTILVSQSWQYPSRLTLTTISPDGRGTARSLWLAGGFAFDSREIMEDNGAWPGQLTASTVHQDLTGLGRPSALVGSSDGYLYLVDPCAGGLDTAVRFDAAVGEAVYGDTDGDGRDEILVTSGDGFLVALQHFSVAAPMDVRDRDIQAGADDVDVLLEDRPLAASWDRVANATSYEVALIDDTGRYVTDWLTTNDLSYVFDGIDTNPGESYRAAVRALGPEGHSQDVGSDGVTIYPLPAVEDPSGAASAGCCDSRNSATESLALAAFVLLTMRRRKARPFNGRVSLARIANELR